MDKTRSSSSPSCTASFRTISSTSANSLALKRNEGTECHKDRSCFRPEHQATTVIEPSLCYLTNRARRPTERSHAFASNVFSSHGKSNQRRINLRNLPGVTSATLGQKMTRKELQRHCPFP